MLMLMSLLNQFFFKYLAIFQQPQQQHEDDRFNNPHSAGILRTRLGPIWKKTSFKSARGILE